MAASPSLKGTGDGKSRGQSWFERAVWWGFLVSMGYGLAISTYQVPDLVAHQEYLTKLLHGGYPGIQVTTEDCRPVTAN